MIFLAQSILIPWLIGVFFVNMLAPRFGHRSFKVFLGAGVGFGLSSCTYFLLLVLASQWKQSIALVEYVLLAALIGLSLYRSRISFSLSPVEEQRQAKAYPTERPWWVLVAGFIACAGLSASYFVLHLLKYSHGGWDAWAIWNLRARFLFRGGEHWKDAFSGIIGWAHPDYPLLIPSLVARSWEYIGEAMPLAPALIGAVFTWATVGLLFSALAISRGRNQALVGGLVLASTPLFITHGALQYADDPLAFFILATLALLWFQDRMPESAWGLGALAGLTAGFAAWTKNEGLLFLLAVALPRFGIAARLEGIKTSARRLVPFLVALAPMLLIVLYFKVALAPPGDLFSAPGIAHRLFDLPRYGAIAGSFAAEILMFGGWYFNPLLLLAIYAACLGIKLPPGEKAGVWTTGATILVMLAGFTMIYAITPADLAWHLGTSMDRLMLQLWPSVLFVLFLVIRSPERVLPDSRKREKASRAEKQASARRNLSSSRRVK